MSDVLSLLGLLFKLVPGLVDLISDLVDGKPETVARVREILPVKSESETALEEMLREYPSD